ncbi:hypothetical protein BJ973_000256 [Actinoplanes tereljensis]|uniref:Uncharacterized protein n=1 Tax=Paractinoplanes tereljensis TaxID=571912 RepID=A0A919NTA3_9ACTN|nr:hypothetical protein [Actinoplanes tereljensis]GIF23387.1 hypothetical protein Ate02nite_61170 [Actinoplanes tereljensis]
MTRAPDGRISLETLKNSALIIPAWPADNVQGPSGRLHFRDGAVQISAPVSSESGKPPTGTKIVLLGAVYGDLDRDGAKETVAEFFCTVEGGSKQVVAFDRDSAGRIVTIGQVVATTGEIRDIQDNSARVGGDGTVTVTVRHDWGTSPRQIRLHFYPGDGLERAGSAWPPIITSPSESGFTVGVAPPAASSSARYTFAFRRPATVSSSTLAIEVSGATAVGSVLSDANPFNNGTVVATRTSD